MTSCVFKAPQREGLPKLLFMFWHQGWQNAPDLVQRCRRSWEYLNPDWEIHALDDRNLSDYLDLGDFSYMSKTEHLPRWSAIIRIHLLEKYGGVWTDATCFCCRPLSSWIHGHMESGFFAFQHSAVDRMVATWFLAAKPGNQIVKTWRTATRRYYLNNPELRPLDWSRPEFLVDHLLCSQPLRRLMRRHPTFWYSFLFVKVLKVHPYFSFSYLFNHCYRKCPDFQATWEKTKKLSADDPHIITFAGFLNPLSTSVKGAIDDGVAPLYKLKHQYRIDNLQITPDCNLGYLMHSIPAAPADLER